MESMERRESHIDLVDKISNIQIEIARGFAESHAHNKESSRDISELKEAQNRILYTLYGNGKEGIITTVAKMHTKLSWMWYLLAALSVSFLVVAIGTNSPLLKALAIIA